MSLSSVKLPFEKALPNSAVFYTSIKEGDLVHPSSCSHADDRSALERVSHCPICRAPIDRLVAVRLDGVAVLTTESVTNANKVFTEQQAELEANKTELESNKAELEALKAELLAVKIEAARARLAFLKIQTSTEVTSVAPEGKEELKAAQPIRSARPSKYVIACAMEKAVTQQRKQLAITMMDSFRLKREATFLKNEMKESLTDTRAALQAEKKNSEDKVAALLEDYRQLVMNLSPNRTIPVDAFMAIQASVEQTSEEHKRQQRKLAIPFGPLFATMSNRLKLERTIPLMEREIKTYQEELDPLRQAERDEINKIQDKLQQQPKSQPKPAPSHPFISDSYSSRPTSTRR